MKNLNFKFALATGRTSYLKSVMGFLCALLLFSVKGEAQTFHFPPVTYLDSTMLRNIVSTPGPDTITIIQGDFGSMANGTANFAVKSVVALAALKVHVQSSDIGQKQKFTYLVAYRTIGTPNPASASAVVTSSDTLSVSYDRDSLALVNDHTFKIAGNFHKLQIIVDNVIEVTNGPSGLVYTPLPPASSTSVPTFVTIVGQIQLQKFVNYPSLSVAGNVSAINNISTTGSVRLNWGTGSSSLANVTPAGYEVEWTYTLPGETQYNFRTNATRIFTNNTSFDIPAAQKQGTIIWRIRMVRPNLTNLLSRTYGPWTLTSDNGSIYSLPAGSSFGIGATGNDVLNWDLKMSFVEDGKYKQVITYYDGLLKQKQVQTRFNALPGQTIVAQSLLDYEGRPVISSLPIPVQGKPNFGYIPNFMQPVGSSQQYNKNTYDALPDASRCPIKETVVAPLNPSSLGNQYYSRQNPNRTGKNAFIPDAEGYPFTRRILAAENPEKVLFEGGAGAPLQLGNNRHTAYLYGVPLQAELNRYFGQDIGKYNYYRKRVTTDGHNQDGFSITDKEGKPVITGLIGSPDTSVLALSIRNAPTSDSFKTNMLPIPSKRMGTNWVLSGSHFVELKANFSVAYGIKYRPFRPCANSTIGLSPKIYYDYEILDECGVVMITDAGTLGNVGTTSAPLLSYSHPKATFLEKGNHVWNKQSYIKIEDVTASVDQYLDLPNSCLSTFDDYLKAEFLKTTFPCPPAGNPCENMRLAMIKEMYPRAKYGHYAYVDNDSARKEFSTTADNQNSIFSKLRSQNGRGEYLYQADCLYGISDDPNSTPINGRPFSVFFKGMHYTSIKNVPPDVLIEIFNDTIGEALLPLHPDYCKLLMCPLLNSDYCKKLGGVRKAEQGRSIGRYELGDIAANDPLGMPSASSTAAFMNAFNPANFAITIQGEAIDSLAFRKTICGSTFGVVETTCEQMNSNKGPADIMEYSEAMQDAYYRNLIALYTSSREERIGEYLRVMGKDCGPCADLRLRDLGEEVNVDTRVDDDVFISGVDSTRRNLNLGSSPSGSSFFNGTLTADSAQAFAGADNSIYCTGQIESIVASLANCSLNTGALNKLRDTLEARFCAPNRGKLAQLTDDSLTSILQSLGIAKTDLCNAGLANLWKTTNRSGPQVQLGLLQYGPDYYQNLESFFAAVSNGQSILDFVGSASASKTVPLHSCNSFPFEKALAKQLNITPLPTNCAATTNVVIDKTILANANVVQLTFKNGTDTLNYYLYPPERTDTNALNAGFNTAVISGTGILGVTPLFNLYGFDQVGPTYANRNTLLLAFTGTRNSVQKKFNYVLSAFNPKTDYLAVEPDVPQYLNGVGCSELLPMVRQTLTRAASLGIKAGHPFFESFFENVTNYNNRVHFGFESYKTAIQSCGVTDSLLIPKHMAHFKVVLPAGSNTEAYLDLVRVNDSVNLTLVNAYSEGGVKHLLLEVDPNGIRNVAEARQSLNNRHPSGISSGNVKYLPSLGRDTLAQLLSSGFSPVNVLALAAAFPTLNVSNTPIKIEYYVPGIGVFVNGTSELITLTPKTVMSNYSYNHVTDDLYKYITTNVPITSIFSHAESAVSDQYANGQMTAWRSYVRSLDSGNHNAVVKGSKPNALALIPGGTGWNFNLTSYVSARYPNYRNDLYIANSSPADVNYGYTSQVLTGLQNSFNNGGYLLKATPTGVAIPSLGGTGTDSTRAYVCSDTSVFWMNHFDGNRKMHNIFIKLPEPLFRPRSEYRLNKISKGFERDSVTTLELVLVATTPGYPADTIVCPAFCNRSMGVDYVIPTAFLSSYSNNNAYAGAQGLTCEQAKIQNLYPAARVNYNLYRDSVRASFVGRFQKHITDSLEESLDLSGRDIKHGITLYYYDVAGNLIRTVSPEGVRTLSVVGPDNDAINDSRTQNQLVNPNIPGHDKETKYYYNAQNKVTRTSSPDAGTTKTYYDLMGRVIFSQDAAQQANNEGVYFIYDRLSRVVESGLIGTVFTWKPENNTTLGSTRANEITQWTRKEVSVTLYDTASYKNATGTFATMPLQDNLKNRVACTKYFSTIPNNDNALIDTAYEHALHYSYDLSGNVKTLVHDFKALLRPELRLKRVDYEYDLYSGKVLMVAYNRGVADGFYQKYSYDADNRITEAYSSVEGVFWDKDAHYDYYEHGPLARTSLGTQGVQGIDYAYTINGWLKAVNGAQNSPDDDMGNDGTTNSVIPRDVASQRIDYFKRDYRAIGTDSLFLEHIPQASKDLFNGNIGGMAVAIAPFKNLYKAYRYDPLQRIETTYNQEYSFDHVNAPVMTGVPDWAANYRYDKDGNLLELNREGGTVPAGQQGPGSSGVVQKLMDALTYRYETGTNKLRNLQDAAPTADYRIDIPKSTSFDPTVTHYKYDPAGRLIKDAISNLNSIEWNRWSKVKGISKAPAPNLTSNLFFTYDATGNRLSKEEVTEPVKDSIVKRRTVYVRDAAGNVLAVYDNRRTYKITTSGRGPIYWPDLEPYPGPIGTVPSDGGVLTTRFPVAWRYTVAGNLLRAYRQDETNNLALMAMELPNLAKYSRESGLVTELVEGLEADQTVAFAKSMPLITNYALGGTAPDEGDEPTGVRTDPRSLQLYLEPVLVGNSDMASYQRSVLAALKAGDRELYDRTVAGIPASEEDKEGFPDTDGGRLVRALATMEVWDRLKLTGGLAEELASKNRELLPLVRGPLMAAYSTANTHTDFVRKSPNAEAIVEQLRADARQYVAHRFRLAGEGVLDKDSVALPFGSNGVLATALSANNDTEAPSQEALSMVLNGYLPQLRNAASSAGRLDELTASLLTVKLELDDPGLTAHIDRWFQTIEVLKEDKTNLAEHHIYGSSRLGIQRYLSTQKVFDAFASGTTGGATASLQTLTRPRAWYSRWGNDLFAATPNATASAQPLGTGAMGFAGIGIQAHVLGNRHYELTNHLGNVLATILDRVTPRLVSTKPDGAKDSLVGYSTDISSAQDYYPFGMLMPGRYISDNTPQCVTTQTTVLVPRIVRVYTELEPVGPVRTTGGPIIASPYPWGPVRSLPVAVSFRDQDVHLFHYLPADQHPDGWVGQVPASGIMELDLSNEPTGLSLYMPFGIDTSAGGSNQVLGFGVGHLPAGCRLEARVRHYPDENGDVFNEVLRWREVRLGEQAELRFGLPAGTAGKLMAELRFSAERGAAQFGPMARVVVSNPWVETTEWVPEIRLVTICEEKDKYRYGFNGQEKVNEVAGVGNHMAFDARGYDTRLGRWWSVDPLAAKYPSLSAYVFVADNPIRYIDPDGREIVDPQGRRALYFDKKGNSHFTKYATSDIKRAVNALNLTSEGMTQLKRIDQSDIKTKIYISSDSKTEKKGDGTHYTYGETVQGNYNGKDNYGRKVNSDGTYGIKEATITIYEGTIMEGVKEGSGLKHEGLTTEQAIGATLGHEGVHATDKAEIDKDLKAEMKGKSHRGREDKPNKVEQKIINQSRELTE